MNIFVIMPFREDFHLVFAHLLKAPLHEKGHTVERSLESNHQHGLRAIIHGITNADLIIADLTNQNANVTYELGIAHTLRKPTLQIAQNLEHVRYDLRPYNVILYSIESDGSSSLADDILGYIEREPGNEYNFSNPVSDFTDSEQNIPIVISTSNIPDNGQQLPLLDANEVGDVESSEYGIIDASADVESANALILSTLQGLSSDTEEIGQKTREHSSIINELSSNPNQQRRNSKALRVLQHFASDVNKFSEKVNEKTPTLKKGWMTLDQSMELVISSNNIKNESDLETIYKLIRQASDLQKNIPNAIASIESFRNSQENLIGLSRVSNPALRGSIKALNRLIDELKLGGSVVRRMIDLATEKIERYSESAFDENDKFIP